MNSRWKDYIRTFINVLIVSLLRSCTLFNRITRKDKTKRVAVLYDTANFSETLCSKELDAYAVGIIVNRRTPLYRILNKKLARLFFIIRVENYSDQNRETLLNACRKLNVHVVLIQNMDHLVPLCNYLNRNLNEKGNSEKASLANFDKSFMRQILNESNIGVVQCKNIECEKDAAVIDFFPCVIKPAVGTNSKGVHLLNSQNELNGVLQKIKTAEGNQEFKNLYIVEEYIEGRQFDVEGIIAHGQIEILAVIEENYSGHFPDFYLNWALFNALIDDKLYCKMFQTVHEVFKVCEVKYGAFHCELKIDNSGNIKILDFANRMGGIFIKPISEATGNNFIDIYIRSMLSKKVGIKKNAGIKILDKYFTELDEYDEWTTFLDKNHIAYVNDDFTNKHIYNKKIRIKTSDQDIIYMISNQFGLDIKRIKKPTYAKPDNPSESLKPDHTVLNNKGYLDFE